MFLECSSCGKMYRVREGTVAAPTKCPACGGVLRASGSSPAPAPAAPAVPAGPDPRVKELEGKVAALERDLATSRADVEGGQAGSKKLESDLAQAREESRKKGAELEGRDKRISELQGDIEKARHQAAQKAQASQLAVLKQKDERIEELEVRISEFEEAAAAAGEAGKSGAESAEKIAQLESELEEARANIPRVAEELANEKSTYHQALIGKEHEIDELNTRLHKLELDLVQASAAAQAGGGGGEAASDVFRKQLEDKEASLQKAQKTISGLERLVQDGERLYLQLRKDMEKLEAGGAAAASGEAAPASPEKDQQIAALEEDVSRQKKIIEDLQKRLQDQEEANRREVRKVETKLRTKSAGGSMDEARHLVSDLDRSLGSVSSQLTALVERVKRLNESLYKTGDESLPEGAMPGTEPEPEAAAPEEPAPSDEPVASAEPMEAPPMEEDAGASVLADAAAEESGERPAVEMPDEPETRTDEVPTVEEAVAREQAKVQAEQGEEELEMLPDSPGESGLPQDETLLDMGKLGKQLRAERPAAAPAPAAKRPDTKLRLRPAAPPPPEEKKGGFFGKLFGKKK